MIDMCFVGSDVKYHSLNCHDVTSGIFDRWISHQTGMKSSLQWHNQPGKKIKDFEKVYQGLCEWFGP